METLGYTITGFSLLDNLQIIIHEIDVSMLLDTETIEFWKKICVYMAKMAMHDYDFISKFNY